MNTFRILVEAALVCAACACARSPEPPASAPRQDVSVAETTTTSSSSNAAPRPRAAGARAQLDVVSATGVPAERVRAIFTPALPPLERCLPGKGGKVKLRITNEDGGLRITMEPGASLTETVGACALEALTTVYLAETASNVVGAGVPPSSFTSLVTLEW